MIKNNKERVVLLTTTHLCKNPRLVKEISALTSAGYNLYVIYWQFSAESIKFDEEITASFPKVNFRVIRWLSLKHPERFFYTLLSKTLKFIKKVFKVSILPEQQLWSGYLKLRQEAVKIQADLYHAHNPGALAAAVFAAKKNHKKTGFDAEDYHRGEIKEEVSKEKELIITLENKYIPQLSLFITSSPLIQKQYIEHYPDISSICILNVFPKQAGMSSERLSDEYLNCVWFSQTVGLNRGLAEVISGMNKITAKSIRLDIIGYASEGVKKELQKLLGNKMHQLNFLGTFSTAELDRRLTQYDIGIASERGKDLNNSYALSNKLFSYIKAGLAVLVSDTPAQKLFFESLSECIGFLYSNLETEKISAAFSDWINCPEKLKMHQSNSKKLGYDQFNWEIEQDKFLNAVVNTLKGTNKPQL